NHEGHHPAGPRHRGPHREATARRSQQGEAIRATGRAARVRRKRVLPLGPLHRDVLGSGARSCRPPVANRAVCRKGERMMGVKKETDRLVKRFIAQLEALGAQMSAEMKAVSWQMAAEVIAAGLEAIAVGSLTWVAQDAVKETKATVYVKPEPKTK